MFRTTRLALGAFASAAVLALPAVALAGADQPVEPVQPLPPAATVDATAPAQLDAVGGTSLDPFTCRSYTHNAVGRVADGSLNEISGVARGRRNTSVMWVHEDSGAKADVIALSLTGGTRQTFRLSGVSAKDWEDMDIGPGPQSGVNYLYLGDIGDNGKKRPNIVINRVPEPAVTGAGGITDLGGTQQILARYPDGARNAEAMAVGADGTIYVFSKETSTRVYAIPYPQPIGKVVTMTRIDSGVLGSRTDVSGADIRPDGRALIVRGYRMAWTWPINPGENMKTTLARTPCQTPTFRDEKQGEAIAFLGNDGSYTSVGEQVNAVMRQYTL